MNKLVNIAEQFSLQNKILQTSWLHADKYFYMKNNTSTWQINYFYIQMEYEYERDKLVYN